MDIFRGRTCVIATMHGKENIIAPILEKHLGVHISVPTEFDSDRFGTFTRDIKRKDNQYNTAKAKVEYALDLTGEELGISSEGSFAPDNEIYLLPANIEMVFLKDRKNHLEIVGVHKTLETNLRQSYISTREEIIEFAQKVGFPEQGIIMRPDEHNMKEIYKDIATLEELLARGTYGLKKSTKNTIFLETDMRAHRNPTRQKAIQKATEDLINTIHSLCPQCGFPGFTIRDTKPGLPCQICGLPTELPLYRVYRCMHCHYEMSTPSEILGEGANPKYCSFCNP